MANPLTNQSGGGTPLRPEASLGYPESAPSEQRPLGSDGHRPSLTAENLDLLEDHQTADRLELDQAAGVAAMFALLQPDKFSTKEGTLKTIADRAQEKLTADGTDLQGLTVHQALEEFHVYLQSGGETKVITQLQNLPENQRLPVERELLGLMLRGHVSGEVMNLILGGGFQTKEQPDQTDPNSDLGIAFATLHPTVGKILGHIDLFLKNLPEQFDIRLLTLHAIAHALILAPVRGGLIYRTEDLSRLLQIALAEPTSQITPQADSGRPSTLDTREILILHRAMGDGNRDVIKPFETPYIVSLLDALDRNPAETLRATVLNEMLAERLAAYLASDGSLADFLHKRLLNASAVQAATGTIDPTHPAAKLAQELELLKIQARSQHWSYDALVPKLQDFSRRLPGLADFLAETIFLDRRFSRALRGPDNLPISLASNKYRLQLLGRLKGEQTNVPIPTITEFYQANKVGTTMYERQPLGQPIADHKDKRFWQVLAEAFTAIMRALGLNF